ncbi:SOS response-associated peptidase [Actinophytocola sp.]|uniref:SOS response-associated peptidase n=1 Tax=Actinophytocola sp. TaxID=1872138 RepID=UPI002D7E3C02|nr:SOS response-associated peptidase [Actinophytocola sp.]HET9138560.1 SOS response-associated peptidase [Actinophytocola sp.]
MCGRYAATKDPATLAAEFDAVDETDSYQPRADYNVAPTKEEVTVVQRHPRDEEGNPDPDRTVRSLRVMRWGLVPFWAKDKSIGAKMINARVESVASKPAFKSSLAKRRCLVPADGWYEWRKDGGTKQPYFMTTTNGASIAFAGLWSTWRDKADEEAEPLVTYTVLTTDALGQLSDIHNRMPLMLPRESWADWLDPDREDVEDLLTSPSLELVSALELRPVSSAVNSVRNNGPELLARYEPAPDLDDPALFDVDDSSRR